jgi:hypothetical protein
MSTRMASGGLILGLLAVGVGVGADPQSEARTIRDLVRAGDYGGAIRRAERLRADDPRLAGTLLALAHWAQAVSADNAAERALITQVLLATVSAKTPELRQKLADHVFVQEALPKLEAFAATRRTSPEETVAPLKEALGALARATAAVEAFGGEASDEERALRVWVRLHRYLCLATLKRNADKLLAPGATTPEVQTALKRILPPADEVRGAEASLQRELVTTLPAAAKARSEPLLRAGGDCLVLYCAAGGRLRSATFGASLLKYTTLPRLGIPPIAGADQAGPAPRDPIKALTAPAFAAEFIAGPEAFIFPAFQAAASLDAECTSPGAHYGLYLAALRVEERAARPALTEWLKRRPKDTAFTLERARLTLRADENAEQALNQLIDAASGRAWERPVFTSLPGEVRDQWNRSSYNRTLAFEFALDHNPLFKLLDTQAGLAKKQGISNLPLLTIRFRLAELLMQSSHLPDVVHGMAEAARSVQILESKPLSDEQRAQAAAYRRSIEAAAGRLPDVPTMLVATERGVAFLGEPLARMPGRAPSPPCLVFTASGPFGYLGAPMLPPNSQ